MLLLARVISLVFNPYFLLLPTPYFFLVKITNNPVYAIKWTIFTAIFIAVVMASTIVGVEKKVFSDLDISRRKQRPIYFSVILAVSLFYLAAIILLHGPDVLFLGVICLLLGLLVLSLINTRVKASMHLATISAIIFGFSLFFGGDFLIFLVMIPIIAWSRLKVHRHSLRETIIGSVLGSVMTLLLYFILKYILGMHL
jgi:hypothetical protein